MYLIQDSRDRIVEICRHPCYVRRQSNGVVVLSPPEQADAIYSNDSDSFYPVEKIGYLCESHTLIEVAKVPPEVEAGYWFCHAGEFYTTEADLTALVKARAPEAAAVAFVTLAETGVIDEATAGEHREIFARWAYPVQYKAGNIRQHEGKLYRCLTGHTSQEDWTPEAAPSLWVQIADPAEEWPTWSQPIGAADAYSRGSKVSHQGEHWKSEADNNVWEPGIYGWAQIKEKEEIS